MSRRMKNTNGKSCQFQLIPIFQKLIRLHGKRLSEKTGRKVGFKAAGGVRTAEEAVQYYTIVKEVLGEGWLDKGYFRLGASSLANAMLSSIQGETVKFF